MYGAGVIRDLETLSCGARRVSGAWVSGMISDGSWRGLDWESGFWTTGASVPSVPSARARRWASGSGTGATSSSNDCTCTSFHVGFTVRLVSRDGPWARIDRYTVRERRSPFQFREDGIFMGKEIPDKAVRVLFFHSHGCFSPRSKNAGSESGCKGCNVRLVCRSKLNKTGKMGHESVKCGDIRKAKLAECILENGDPSGVCRFGGGG